MTATNNFETSILSLIFNNENMANIGDATGIQGSTTDGVFWLSLHTSDPGETGDQTTNEATYTSYARVSVARTTSGWTVSGSTVTNTATISFPAATGGTSTVTHFGLGTNETSTGNLLFTGALVSSLAVSNGITPSFAAGSLSITVD